MNILVLAQIFPPAKGGSGRWLWELYRRLGDATVAVVAGRSPGAEAFDRTSELPITRIDLNFSSWGMLGRGAREYLRAFRALFGIVVRSRPDAIHCGKCLPEGLLATFMKWSRRVPFSIFVHGEELTLAGTTRELRRLTRAVLAQAATVIANSEHTREILLRDWSVAPDRILVMHPGVDTGRFVPGARDESVRARLGWGNRRVILTVGALQKRKGQDMLIRALPAIRTRCPDVLYAIVGEGWERQYLEALAAEHGVSDLVQFRPPAADDGELLDCYQQCDLFALPNRQIGWDFEGFGIVLLEAQACGKAVIAGRSGGTCEAMKPSCTGELVACDEPDALASTVIALLDAPEVREQMGARGRAWTVGHFDWAILADQARGRLLGQH